MKKNLTKLCISMIVLAGISPVNKTLAHCEIPCGIYEDSLRIQLIREHASTIEKSIIKILELQKQETPNYNQIVRWVINKEEHAIKLQEIVSQYFLHQRIKPTEPDDKEYTTYLNQLELLHKLLVYSMKAKQSTDLANVGKLKANISSFEEIYFHKH